MTWFLVGGWLSPQKGPEMFVVYEVFKSDGKRYEVYQHPDRMTCEVWMVNRSCDWSTVVRGSAEFVIEEVE